MLNCHIKGLQMLQLMRFLPVNFEIFVSIKAFFFVIFINHIPNVLSSKAASNSHSVRNFGREFIFKTS